MNASKYISAREGTRGERELNHEENHEGNTRRTTRGIRGEYVRGDFVHQEACVFFVWFLFLLIFVPKVLTVVYASFGTFGTLYRGFIHT